MVLLRLLFVFGFIAVMAGCNASDDVKALGNKVDMVRTDLEQFKADIMRVRKALVAIGHRVQPCKTPAEHSDLTCYYKLQILKVLNESKGLYQGRVPDSVILEQNNLCTTAQENGDPKQCVNYGDTNPYTFFINGDKKYKEKDVVECTNDPKNDDPNPNHLNCTEDKAMKKT